VRSIRGFLIGVTLSAIVLVMFVASVQGYRRGIAQTVALLDTQLTQHAKLLSVSTSPLVQRLKADDQFAYQVFDTAGVLIARSEGAPDTPLIEIADQAVTDASFNGQRWRVLRYDATDLGRVVYVAENAAHRFIIAEQIVNATLLPILIGMPILALISWLVISVGLRHVQTLAKAVSERGTDNLAQIDLYNVPTELAPVVANVNTMLAQLAASFDREKRFASDAAHELRTPISALKVNIHNLRKRFDDNDDFAGLSENVSRITHLIDQLLLLYRTSSENLRADFTSVSLAQICQEVVRDRYALINNRHQEIELYGDDIAIKANHFALSALVANLVDNASKYTPEQGHITLRITEMDGKPELYVEDNGIGIPEASRERVLDRFFRVNTGLKISGCGLGLSIVQHVAALHDASVTIEPSCHASGTLVRVSFPAQSRVSA
jgi:two-component system sensor histidine kinase QseC